MMDHVRLVDPGPSLASSLGDESAKGQSSIAHDVSVVSGPGWSWLSPSGRPLLAAAALFPVAVLPAIIIRRWTTSGENGSDPLSEAVAPSPINFSVSGSWSDRWPPDVEPTDVEPPPTPPPSFDRFKMDFFRSGLDRPLPSINTRNNMRNISTFCFIWWWIQTKQINWKEMVDVYVQEHLLLCLPEVWRLWNR